MITYRTRPGAKVCSDDVAANRCAQLLAIKQKDAGGAAFVANEHAIHERCSILMLTRAKRGGQLLEA